MRYKASFFSGLAAGYVLGARAGRERYEQILRAARALRENPQVQHAADTVQTQAGHLMGSAVHVATDKGKAVTAKVTEKVGDKLPPRLSERLPGGMRPHHETEWDRFSSAGPNGSGL